MFKEVIDKNEQAKRRRLMASDSDDEEDSNDGSEEEAYVSRPSRSRNGGSQMSRRTSQQPSSSAYDDTQTSLSGMQYLDVSSSSGPMDEDVDMGTDAPNASRLVFGSSSSVIYRVLN